MSKSTAPNAANALNQGFSDWLEYQKSMMEKMTSAMKDAQANMLAQSKDAKAPALDMDAMKAQAHVLTEAWQGQMKQASEKFAYATKKWAESIGIKEGAMPGMPNMSNFAKMMQMPEMPQLPTMPNFIDPNLQAKLQEMFSKFGVNATGADNVMPSMADAMFGRMAQAPSFAHLWDFDQKTAVLMGAWSKLNSANFAYRALVAKAWGEAQQATAKKLSKLTTEVKDGKSWMDWREGMDAWLAELNTALHELMRTQEYLGAQKKLLAAGIEVREQLKKVGEEVAEWFQLPGRNEVDDLAKSVAEMRRQLRRMTQAGDEVMAAVTPKAAKPAAKKPAARKPAAKKPAAKRPAAKKPAKKAARK